MSAQPEYNVGDYVEITRNRKGVIRFQGSVGPFGKCFGIELDAPNEGGNNGTFDGEVFFECDDGKGTFVKGAKIIRTLDDPPPQSQSTSTTKNAKSSPKSSTDDSKHDTPEDDKEKKKKKRTQSTKGGKKKSKKSTTGKSKGKSTTKTSSSSAADRRDRRSNKSKTSAKRSKSKGKRSAAAKVTSPKPAKKRNKSVNGIEDFVVPSDVGAMAKLELIYPKLSSHSKLPFKNRIELMKMVSEVMSDESCDAAVSKYAVDGFKKVFTEQIKDKKLLVHREVYGILNVMMVSHYKVYKNKNTYYLKCLMNHFCKLKPNDKKGVDALVTMIKSMIRKIGLKDKKQMIVMLNEFLRNGTNSKLKTVKEKSWHLIYISLQWKAEQKKDSKLSRDLLDSIEKGLKQSLSNNDRLVQEGAFRILDFLAVHGETARVAKLFGRMSATAQKLFTKKYPASAPQKKGSKKKKSNKLSVGHRAKKLSVGQYAFDADAMAFINKKDSAERLDEIDTGKKRSKTKKKKTKDEKKSKSGLRDRYNKMKEKDNKKKAKKGGSKGKKKVDKKKDKTEKKKKEKKKKKTKGSSRRTNSHQRSDRNVLGSLEPDSFGDLGDLLGGAALLGGDDEEDDDAIEEALDLPVLPDAGHEEEEIEIEHDDEEENTIKIIASTTTDAGGGEDDDDEDEFPNFPFSFLEIDTRINWKTLEYLCSANKSNLLMSVLSRLNATDFDLTANKLDAIDYTQCIPSTLPLSSDDESEIASTQLSYNLMRFLSMDGSGDDGGSNGALSSYLLRKCDEIVLHSLCVYHTSLSRGNVYHGRVLLEILLNSWPKPLMTHLTKDTTKSVIYSNIQILFKNALFRNLHQGNLNSFFLDLICYREMGAEKKKMIALFKKWKFMQYLLETSSSFSVGMDGDDDVATKYATFFIDLVARSAAIAQVAPLFEGQEHLIIDSFVNGLLDVEKKRSTWHRMFCGQILIQFMDICSRPSIMDPTQLLAAESGLIEPEPSPNILYPLFSTCLKRLHSYIPQLSKLVIHYESDFKSIQLNTQLIEKPFGQIRLHCLELLTISADFAQFECGNVLGQIPLEFWNYLLEMAFIHRNNNIFLCHFRRLIHLTMIFRRRILKHLFVEKKLLARFISFYVQNKQHTPLHGYVLQMVYDIWQHDQDVDSDDDEHTQHNEDSDEEDTDSVKHVSHQFL
eukprot:206799_1